MKLVATASLAIAVGIAAGCSSPSRAPAPAAASLPSGIDLAGMDQSVAPGDDFNAYANGGWNKSTPIPADKSSYGASSVLVDETRKQTVALIQDPVNAGPNATPDARKVGDFYASFMDEAGIESKGLAPLKPELDAIAAIADTRALARVIGGTIRADVDPLNATNFQTEHLFGVWIAQGLTDPDHNTPYLLQGGLGLPDRDYYVSTSPKMADTADAVLAARRLGPRARRVLGITRARGTHRRPRDEDGPRACDPRAVGRRAPAGGLDPGGACCERTRARLAGAPRGRRLEGRNRLHRLASSRGERVGRARGQGAARHVEGLAGVSCGQRGDRLPAKGVRGRRIRLLRKDAQRDARAAAAMAAGRRRDERRAWRGRRQAVCGAPFSAGGEGEGARHGGRPHEGVRQANRRARMDDARHQGQGAREGEDAVRRRRLSRQVDRLHAARDRQG